MSEQAFQAQVMDELKLKETKMEYRDIRKFDVSAYVEKKGKFNYLSWAWAVDQLLLCDQSATWQYQPPTYFHDNSMMVYCSVTAFGKTMTAQLAVMDNKNSPIVEPNSVQVNIAMQRCLAKAIALHGLGLYIYQGEDLPEFDADDYIASLEACSTLAELQKAFADMYDQIKETPVILKRVTMVKDRLKAEFLKVEPTKEA